MPEAIRDLLAGVASIFDFKDHANDDMDVHRSDCADYSVIREDWDLVGSDLWAAIDGASLDHSPLRD